MLEFLGKYGAPRQAKHEQINVFRPVAEHNFIPEFIFILSSAQFSLPILFFPPSEDLSKF
jgi:hypothetical protein